MPIIAALFGQVPADIANKAVSCPVCKAEFSCAMQVKSRTVAR